MNVVFWTYEASEHCNDCALKRFGRDALDNDETTDSEDNPLRPVFDTDEVLSPPYCGTCRNPIDYDMGPLTVHFPSRLLIRLVGDLSKRGPWAASRDRIPPDETTRPRKAHNRGLNNA